MVRVNLEGRLEARFRALQVARLEARQATLEMAPRVLGRRAQNFSSPRWRSGSGKSR